QQTSMDEKINWLRHVLETKGDDSGSSSAQDEDFIQRYRETLFEDRVYAVSPKGDVVDMSAGSTPLDFAYHIHTEVGHRCRGALVNGKIVPLTYKIQSGDRIEILTSKESKPSRDWLIDGMGYIASSRSREKIRSWFRQQDQEQNLRSGKQLLEKELTRLGFANKDPDALAHKHGFPSYQALCISLGAGALALGEITNTFLREIEDSQEDNNFSLKRKTTTKRASSQTAISGVDDLLTTYAQCCKPVPPEDVVGYITQGKGITIHRLNCNNLKNLMAKRPERVFPVSWQDKSEQNNFVIDIAIEAYDRKHLIRDVTALLSEEKVPILEMNSKVNKKKMIATITLTIEIPNIDSMSRIMKKLEALPTIYSVQRN
ncbi:MAG: TGS domain-containing protein, partial [Gammaproteobacteria bacterium]|nr:TGS domain-containing protein [Gammaproteobacteria bacterium]